MDQYGSGTTRASTGEQKILPIVSKSNNFIVCIFVTEGGEAHEGW